MSVWSKIYERINWKDLPQRLTALAARNLNKMDLAIDTIDDRVIALDNDKVSSVTVTNTLPTGDTIATITVDGTATNIKSAQVVVDDTPSATSENPLQNKAIYEMLNNLLPEETAEGNPISISDASGLNAKACSVDLLPIQDLHGYDSPWVGGAGKNKLQVTATTQTINGVTFTVNSDGTISLSGTASDTSIFDVATFSAVGGTAYKLSGCPSGGSTSKYLLSIPSVGYDSGSGYNYTPSTSADVIVRITIYSGQNTQGLIFKPMICLASAPNPDYAHFEPYSNICPISGRTQASVVRTGKNLLPMTVADIKSANTSGTWNDNEYTINGVTFTCNFGEDGFLTTIEESGTATSQAEMWLKTFSGLDGNYYFSGGIDNNKYITFKKNDSWSGTYIKNADVAVTFESTDTIKPILVIGSGQTGTATFMPMLRFSTVADSTYEPYTAETYTETLGQTVYGGKVDFVSGKLTIDRAIVTYVGNEGWYEHSSGRFYVNGTPSGIDISKRGQNDLFKCNTRSYITDQIGYGAYIFYGSAGLYCSKKDANETLSDFTTALGTTNMQVTYPLATPIELTLTPEEISLLKGNNVISTDGDNINLKYSADIKAWVENQLSV